MKLLYDQNLSLKLCRSLADLFPTSNHVQFVGLAHANDREVWEYAKVNNFVLVSLDSDFAEMVTLLKPPPKVIWLRCGNQPTATIDNLFRQHADAIAGFELDQSASCLEIY
jgi:predicted nuclease of predicted toxin-antitoxin system